MVISEKEWLGFVEKLRVLDNESARQIKKFAIESGAYSFVKQTYEVTEELIAYAYSIVTKYGEAAAALSAELYDELAQYEKAIVPPAVPAPTATYREVRQTIYGSHEFSPTVEVLGAAQSRLVKQAGVDTTVQNAIRDRAQIAFVPHGDTCAYCIALAGGGWRPAYDTDMDRNGHVAHCHSNCDCTFAVRFGKDTTIGGYDPTKYKHMYYDAAPYGSSKDKINAMRREFYAENKGKIAEQKATAYERRQARESPEAEEMNV